MKAHELIKQAKSALKARAMSRLGSEKSPKGTPQPMWYFDPVYYADQNPDVMAAGLDPYLHFLQHGFEEGRNPHPLLDLGAIRTNVAPQSGVPLTVEGLGEALDQDQVWPHRSFDAGYYLASNPDVRGMGAVRHFILYGAAEGRMPHPDYDPQLEDASLVEWLYQALAPAPAPRGVSFANGITDITLNSSRDARAGTDDLPRASAIPAGVQGWLDSAVDGVACGWAHDPEQPSSGVEVEILEGSRVVGRGTAALHRGDLQRAGYGDGRCGFAIKLSSLLRDGSSHVLRARVVNRAGTLLNGALVYETPADAPRFDVLPSWEVATLSEEWTKDWTDRQEAHEFVLAFERYSLLLETDRGEDGLTGLQALAERHGSSRLLQIKIGDAHLATNAPGVAIKAYERALEDETLADWALLGMGNCHRLLGNWEIAADCYKRGLSLPRVGAPHGERLRELEDRVRILSARRLMNAGDTESALHALLPVFVIRPEDSTLRSVVCEVLDRREAQTGSGEATSLDAEALQSKRAVDLLQTVLDHFAGDGIRK